MAGYEVVNPPGGMSYGAPLVDFSTIGNLANTYYQGQQNRRQNDIATAFKGGLPVDPATGQPDYGKIMQVLAQKGDINAVGQLAVPQLAAQQYKDAGTISPLLAGMLPAAPGANLSGNPAPQQQPGASSSPITSTSLPAPAAGGLNAGDNAGSVADVVGSRLPQDSSATGAVINNIARAVGVDPNAPLTPAQSARVTQLVNGYAQRTGIPNAPQTAPATPAAAPSPMSPNARVAQAFTDAGGGTTTDAVPPASASLGARTVEPAVAPAQAPAPAALPPAAPAPHPIMPQVPLPPGYRPGQEQQAILALQTEAARLSRNPRAAGQVKALDEWASRIAASIAPVKVGQADTIMDPRTGQVLVQGPAAAAFARGGSPSTTLDADAERYRQTGTLPPNMGRGVQGQAEAQAIRTRATELELAGGGNPNTWPDRWQEYRAEGVGRSAGARVRATREENLNLILKVTNAAIPAALEQSAKVAWRSGQNPLTSIIQRGMVMTSNADLKTFGMANLQLAEGWARAMNPTGVMRESDRDKALSFLSTQDTPETYRAAVMQLQKQIQRERDSIRNGNSDTPAPGADPAQAAPVPGAPPTVTTKAEYDRLPSGTKFVDENGHPWSKP